MLTVSHQFLSKLRYWENNVCQACVNGGTRHTIVFGIIWMLDHDHSPYFFGVLDAHRSLRSTAGKYDGNRFAPLTRQTAEEVINWTALAMRLGELSRFQLRIGHEDTSVGWDHIDMIGFHLHFPRHLPGGHLCVFLQYLSHMAFMLGVQVC